MPSRTAPCRAADGPLGRLSLNLRTFSVAFPISDMPSMKRCLSRRWKCSSQRSRRGWNSGYELRPIRRETWSPLKPLQYEQLQGEIVEMMDLTVTNKGHPREAARDVCLPPSLGND